MILDAIRNHLGTPEDLVGTAVFLAAPATGQCIYVDGDEWPLPPVAGGK